MKFEEKFPSLKCDWCGAKRKHAITKFMLGRWDDVTTTMCHRCMRKMRDLTEELGL